MIDGSKFFDQPLKNDRITYGNVKKLATSQGDDCTIGCLLHHLYFKRYHKMTAVDLRKQQTLDINPKAIQQIIFTGNLDQDRNTTMFFIIEETNIATLDFSEETMKFF